MADHCCATHVRDAKNRDALFYRNIIVLVMGLLLQFHELEAFLFHGQLGVISFVSLTAMFIYVLIKDFEHINMKTHLRRVFMSLLLWAAIQPILNISALPALICLLTVATSKYTLEWLSKLAEKSTNINLLTIKQSIQSTLDKIYTMAWIPSMEMIVLSSLCITWSSSALIVFHPLIHGEVLLHDTFMQLSVYNLGRWLRSHFDSSAFFHNHTTRVTVEVPERNVKGLAFNHKRIVEKPIHQLRKGDIVIVDKLSESQSGVYLPVQVELMPGTSIYRDCQGEQKVTKTISESDHEKILLAAHHKVYQGNFLCTEDYQSNRSKENKNLRKQHTLKDDLGTRVFLFLMYATALSSSLTTALHVGFVLGIEKLCLTLMVACPCVYMVIRPATLSKVFKLVPHLGFLMCTESLPLINKRKTIVFDRTGTLWHENPQDKQGPYIISPDAQQMLKNLIRDGVNIKILSGHSTNGWEENLRKTKELLRSFRVKDVDNAVIFCKDLHGENSKKGEYIKNLKRYNYYGLNPTWSQKIWGQLFNLWSPQSVIMIGDDINDEKAMKAADISVAVGHVDINSNGSVGKNNLAFNDQIETYAHFLTNKDHLPKLYKLMMTLDRSSLWIRILTIMSAVFGVALMSIVSGIIQINMSVNPAFLCMFTTSYCFAVTLLSRSSVLDNILKKSITKQTSNVAAWRAIANTLLDLPHKLKKNLDSSLRKAGKNCYKYITGRASNSAESDSLSTSDIESQTTFIKSDYNSRGFSKSTASNLMSDSWPSSDFESLIAKNTTDTSHDSTTPKDRSVYPSRSNSALNFQNG